MFITKLSHYSVILGISWLRSHDSHIHWKANTLIFNSSHCLSHCLTALRSTIVHELSVIPEFLLPYACLSARVPLSSSLDAKIPEGSPQTTSFNANCFAKVPLSISLDVKIHKGSPQITLDVAAIEAAPFNLWVKCHLMEVFAISLRDIEKALESKKHFDPAVKLLKEYHQFLDIFSRQEADMLPVHQSYDHKIPLEDEKQLTFKALYSMSQDELKVLQKYLNDHLFKGFIWASFSLAAVLILFVHKSEEGLRFCVDYWELNVITVKNRYSLLLIKETLDCLCNAVVYIKLDIIAAFNCLRIAEGEEWKTAFWTYYELYKYLVMPFDLANALSLFQYYINDTLRDYLDIFCTVYIDDILIYSNFWEEYTAYVKKVLERLWIASLQINISKCKFNVTEVCYLGIVKTMHRADHMSMSRLGF